MKEIHGPKHPPHYQLGAAQGCKEGRWDKEASISKCPKTLRIYA